MARKYLGKAVGCKFRITLEEYPKASFSDQRKPADLARQYPHLRPCKLYDWKWIYRTSCNYCEYAIIESGSGDRQDDYKPDKGNQSKVSGLQSGQRRGAEMPRPTVSPVALQIRKIPVSVKGDGTGTDQGSQRKAPGMG